jgi:hypothetical protein
VQLGRASWGLLQGGAAHDSPRRRQKAVTQLACRGRSYRASRACHRRDRKPWLREPAARHCARRNPCSPSKCTGGQRGPPQSSDAPLSYIAAVRLTARLSLRCSQRASARAHPIHIRLQSAMQAKQSGTRARGSWHAYARTTRQAVRASTRRAAEEEKAWRSARRNDRELNKQTKESTRALPHTHTPAPLGQPCAARWSRCAAVRAAAVPRRRCRRAARTPPPPPPPPRRAPRAHAARARSRRRYTHAAAAAAAAAAVAALARTARSCRVIRHPRVAWRHPPPPLSPPPRTTRRRRLWCRRRCMSSRPFTRRVQLPHTHARAHAAQQHTRRVTRHCTSSAMTRTRMPLLFLCLCSSARRRWTGPS